MHDQAPRIIAALRQRLGTYERVADVARVSTATVLKWRASPPTYMHRDAFRRLADAYVMIQGD
jgi:hypothetical protein